MPGGQLLATSHNWNISRDMVVNFLIGIIFFCNTLFAGNVTCSYSSLICFILYLLYLYTYKPLVYFKYLHFLFGGMISVAGCATIEFFSIDLREISDVASFHGSLPLLVLTWWLFLTTLVANDDRIGKKLQKATNIKTIKIEDNFSPYTGKSNRLMTIATIVGFVLITFAFITVFKNPSFKLGLDRFAYAKEFDYGVAYGQAKRFARYLIIPCIVVALYKNKKISWIALFIYCLHALWTGEKFGTLFSLLCMLTMIYSQKILDNIKKLRKFLVAILIAVIALVGVALFAVSFTGDAETSDYLVSRLAQQSQLWWKTYDKSSSYHIAEFGDEIKSIRTGDAEIGNNVGAKYGIYKIMYYTTPKTQVDAKLNSGSRYTEAGFAAAYYYLGIPGCILFAVIGGILVSTFVNYFLYYLRYGQYVRAFIHFRLYTNMAVFMSMFIFFPFFNKTSILSYIILITGRNKIFKFGNEQV